MDLTHLCVLGTTDYIIQLATELLMSNRQQNKKKAQPKL